MKISKVLIYGSVLVVFFVLMHLNFPQSLSSGVKIAIDSFLTNPLTYWWFIFPLIGLLFLMGIVIYYGIHILASFGKGYRTKTPYYTDVSILIASKNEKILLERTLNSIIESTYPIEKIQLIIITSGSTDNTTEFCNSFARDHGTINIEVLSDNLPKQGKPPALNYGLKYVKNDIIVFITPSISNYRPTFRSL